MRQDITKALYSNPWVIRLTTSNGRQGFILAMMLLSYRLLQRKASHIDEDTRTYQEYVTPIHVVANYKMASKLQETVSFKDFWFIVSHKYYSYVAGYHINNYILHQSHTLL